MKGARNYDEALGRACEGQALSVEEASLLVARIAALEAIHRAVLAWWQKHQCDATPDGDGDERNTYDEPPEFVALAQALSRRIEEGRDG